MDGQNLYELLVRAEKNAYFDEMTMYAIKTLLLIAEQQKNGNFELVLLYDDADSDEIKKNS